MIVSVLETFSTDKFVPFANCICRLSKFSVQYNRDITEREYENCRKVCIVFEGIVSNNEMLDHFLQFNGQPKKVSNKIVKSKSYFTAHNGSGFESYVVLTNLPQWKTVVSLFKNRSGIVSLKIFTGYADENKKIPQYVHFTCGRVHMKNSLKNIGLSYKLQPRLLEQELEHDELYENTCDAREREWLPYLKNDASSSAFFFAI